MVSDRDALMPFLRDEGPPVSKETLEEARRSLPIEYGWKFVNERGRGVIVVRVPHPRPDYLHELTEVALYVGLDEVKKAKDVLLVGDEKVCRLEPVLLRDHIRERNNEDAEVVQSLNRKLDRNYGWTVVDHRFDMSQHSVGVRVPRASVAQITPEDVQAIRAALAPQYAKLADVQGAFIVADGDYERLGRRVFFELVDPEALRAVPKAPDNVLQRAPGVLVDKSRASSPSVAPAGGMGGVPGQPFMPPQNVVKQVFTAPPPSPQPLMRGTGTTYEAGMRTALPTDPAPNAPAQPAAPAAPAHREFEHKATKEYEVFVAKPKDTPAPVAASPPVPVAPLPSPPPSPPASINSAAPGFVQTVHHDEYEVFVSKKAQPEATAVERAKDEVTDIVAAAARPPTTGPAHDSGAPLVVTFQPQAPPAPERDLPDASAGLARLAEQLNGAGYRVVRALEVEGTTFDLAAHRDGGKRILAKTLVRLDSAQVNTLATVADRLGADVCFAVCEDVAGGARLAAWGTRVEVVTLRQLADLEV